MKANIEKACGKAVREISIQNSNGYKVVTKVHKSKKTYTRKFKHKNSEI